MGDREAILGALPQPTGTPLPGVFPTVAASASKDELWALFADRFQALSGVMGTMEDLRAMLPHPHLLDEPAAALGIIKERLVAPPTGLSPAFAHSRHRGPGGD